MPLSPLDQPLTAYGKTKTIAQWLDDPLCAPKASELLFRLKRGIRPEKALSEEDKAPKKSRFKGVTYHGQRDFWWARLWVDGKSKTLGLFPGKAGEIQAAILYDSAVRDARGEDAETNF